MNEKKPIIIACVVLFLIVSAGGSAIYYLQFVKLPEREKVLADAVADVKQAQEKKAAIPKLEAAIKDLTAQEIKKKTRIPDLDGLEYDGLANLLDDIRKRAGVDVSKGTFALAKTGAGARPGAAAANVHSVQYDLGVKGGFHQLLRYINMLEKDRRFLNVDSFVVSKGSDTGAAKSGVKGATQAMRDLKVTISSYTYRVPPPPAKPAAKETDGGRSTDVPE